MRRSGHCVSLPAALALALLAVGLAAACGGASRPTGLLEGSVTVGPVQPVEQIGGGSNARPYAAVIDIETPDGDAVATVESGSDGRFSVRLEESAYRLVPRSPKGRPFPMAKPLDTSVTAGKTTTVEILYDSGIR